MSEASTLAGLLMTPELSLAFVGLLLIVLLIVVWYVHKLGKNSQLFDIEEFILSKGTDGTWRANPHKLAFLLSFVICSWIAILIAPSIPTSAYALYFGITFMVVFTVSLLSKSALTIIRDIVQIIITKKAPVQNKTPGGETDE